MGQLVKFPKIKELEYINIQEYFSGEENVKLPLVGRIAAGQPILAEENIEDYLFVPRAMVPNQADGFLLKVKGDSMLEDHILDGDMVVCRIQPTAKNGEIVVAVIEGEATIKRFYREKDHIRLQPANKKYKPIILEEDFIINGIVTGVIRFSS